MATPKQQVAPFSEQSGAKPGRYGVFLHRANTSTGYRSLWAGLPGGACSTPFQSPAFLDAFLETIVPKYGMRFHVGEVRSLGTGSPVALFPFVVQKRGPVRIASFPDAGLADQVAPVLANGHLLSDNSFASAWASFTGALRGVDLVDIDKLPALIGDRANPLYALSKSEPSGEVLSLDLTGDACGTWRRKSVYKTVRSKEKRLVEAGAEFVRTQDPKQCLAILDALKQQRKRRFSAIGRTDSLEARAGFSDFYRHLAANASDGGPVMAFCLKAGDEIVSAYFALADGNLMNGVLISIGDDKWHGCSPGMVLTARIIEWSVQHGLANYCFGTGLQDYKTRFGGTSQPMRRVSQPLTSLGRLFVVARQLRHAAR
ncbi:MAG: GNAT family N-acetyltransferase [Oricola sp.]